jgi:hypothetical protein
MRPTAYLIVAAGQRRCGVSRTGLLFPRTGPRLDEHALRDAAPNRGILLPSPDVEQDGIDGRRTALAPRRPAARSSRPTTSFSPPSVASS